MYSTALVYCNTYTHVKSLYSTHINYFYTCVCACNRKAQLHLHACIPFVFQIHVFCYSNACSLWNKNSRTYTTKGSQITTLHKKKTFQVYYGLNQWTIRILQGIVTKVKLRQISSERVIRPKMDKSIWLDKATCRK